MNRESIYVFQVLYEQGEMLCKTFLTMVWKGQCILFIYTYPSMTYRKSMH